MGEWDAIGDAVTGGMLARAVEPSAGEAGADGHTHETNCLNCGAPLTGPYCSACGQKAHVHRSLKAFMGDFVAGVLNFEGKFWRTLPMLAWRPGELTCRYIAGERARFISPIALYLFTVFAMFAVLNFNGTFSTDGKPDIKVSAKEGIKTEIAAEQKAVARLVAERKSAGNDAKELARLDREIAEKKAEVDAAQKLLSGKSIITTDPGDDAPDWIKPFIENAKENPEAVSLRVQEAASKYSWLLIPLSVPFLWLLFPFSRRYRLYDHTVFVTYSLSFMMMLVITAGLMVALGASGYAGLLFFVPPFHMYRQLKEAYQLGRTNAILRTCALVTFAFAAAGMFAAATVAIGAM
ncbi:DUF3667 domain-containing protein [Sphingomonas sp.]|uniref:DUF3667 domain-containing protein n=1 Tax=Sphingomonas sp. TaxID=28214 RepID=UPI0025F17553|nr:DUF3667 domain-containing protein [Sphingomonas sp.]